MVNLCVLKVKIGINNNGSADYPDFNQLAVVQNSGMDWSKYVDRYGSGWLYDFIGHKEEDAESPFGQQWAILLVPKDFVDQAVVRFSNVCTKLNPAEADDFYNNRHAKDMEDEDINLDVLQKIKMKQDLGLPLTAKQQRAIDPEDDTPGIRKNKRKLFTDYKKERGYNIVN
uniref:Uncharacterized protein n=1 Tax=viral metagenome TaxID=1070528 RepID=A0A6M3L992_9ZZZZ